MLSLPCLENIMIRFLWMDLSIALLGVVSNIYSRSKIVGSCMSFDKILCIMNFPANMYMLWFKFIFGLIFFIPVWFWFPFVSDYDNEYETKKNQNKSGLKNFKPKINLNHNIYIWKLMKQMPSFFCCSVFQLHSIYGSKHTNHFE